MDFGPDSEWRGIEDVERVLEEEKCDRYVWFD
jgi:hypothetical protein